VSEEIAVIPMAARHAAEVAELHRTGIHTGFLSSLGPRFLKQLYRAVPAAPSGFGFVGERDGRILGFIACAERVGAVYKQCLMRRGLAMGWALVPRALRPSVFRRIVETLVYPSKIEDEYPPAEVLSIVAAEAARGTGLAGRLMNAAFDEFRRRGLSQVKVLVWNQNARAKAFYEKCGFVLAGQRSHHESVLDVYVIDLGAAAQPAAVS